jgi:hypothetical protein
MRRLLVLLSIIGLSLSSAPAPRAAAAAGVKCEAYCLFVAGGCYAKLARYVGWEKCDALYEGCMDGCRAVKEVT